MTQGPAIQVEQVASLAELADVNVAELTDNTLITVTGDTRSVFQLHKTSLLAADGVDIIAPNAGSPIAGAATALWVRNAPARTLGGLVSLGSGAPATYTILTGPTAPVDSTEQYTIQLLVRQATGGISASYTRVITVTRDGTGAPTIAGTTDLITQEQASGTVPADWSLVASAYSGNDLLVQFAIATNTYAGVVARAIVTRNFSANA